MIDPKSITQELRAMYRSRLLIVAVNHLNVFEIIAEGEISLDKLQSKLSLAHRPMMVLIPSLVAMGFLNLSPEGQISLSDQGQFLNKNKEIHLANYVGLEAQDPGALDLLEKLKNDGPLQEEDLAYVKEEDKTSRMDDSEESRYFTLALAGRAQYLSPLVADKLPQSEGHLLDVAGGSGFFTFEYLKKNNQATATLFDRQAVLDVAKEFCSRYDDSLQQRVTFLAGDMLQDDLPKCDVLLAASLFHDWDLESCHKLSEKFAGALNPKAELWVHDAFLNDNFNGPMSVCDYSAQLFSFTKGRIYSRQEHNDWFEKVGLKNLNKNTNTLLDYSLIAFGQNYSSK